MTVFAAWRFSYLRSVAREADAALTALPVGADIPAAPELVQADDGTPEVWLLDGTSRRHVKDPASMAAWQLDFAAVVKAPAAKVYAYAKGPDWPEAPFLAEGSGPAVYFIDVAPPSQGGTDGGAPADGGAVGTPPSAIDAGSAGDASGASAAPGAAPDTSVGSSPGGCACRTAPSPPGGGAAGLLVGVVVGLSCARRRLAP